MSSLAVFISFSGLHLNNARRNVCTSPVKKNAEQESDLSIYLFLWTSREREKKKRPPCVTQSPFSVCVFCPRISKKENKKKLRSNFGHTHSRRCRHVAKNKKKKKKKKNGKWKTKRRNGRVVWVLGLGAKETFHQQLSSSSSNDRGLPTKL